MKKIKLFPKIFFGMSLVALSTGFTQAQQYDGQKAANYALKYVVDKSQQNIGKCGDYLYSSPNSLAYTISNSYWGDYSGVCTLAWNNKYNKYYKRLFNGLSGTDCTNFVSQALYAGGIKYDYDGNGYREWYHKRSSNWGEVADSISWINARVLRQRFVNSEIISKKVSKSNAKVGDVIFFKHRRRDFSHAAIVTFTYDGGYVFYSAHQTDRKNHFLSKKIESDYQTIEYWRPTSKSSSETVGSHRIDLDDTVSRYLSSSSGRSVFRVSKGKRPYAETFNLTLTRRTRVKIELTSSYVDTYLFLSKNGDIREANDDIVRGDTNSQIISTLPAGTWQIEVTTYNPSEHGYYTLSVEEY